MYPLSPCERDSGVSVFGLARSPPSLSRTLSLSLSNSLFLALCPRSCFSLSLFVLADTQWHLAATRSPTCVRGDTHASHTHKVLFVLAVTRCHLAEPLNANDQPNTPLCLLLPSVDPPPPNRTQPSKSNQAECVVNINMYTGNSYLTHFHPHMHNLTLPITPGVLLTLTLHRST